MQEAAKVGMDLINDIRALREPGALEIAGELNLPNLYYAHARTTSYNAN